jgi:hypothetical protein
MTCVSFFQQTHKYQFGALLIAVKLIDSSDYLLKHKGTLTN